MGKVPIYPKQELSEVQAFKQNNRKVFDSNSNNEKRLLEIKKLKHNYERSQAMLNSVLLMGLDDSAATVNTIIEHLLEIGQSMIPIFKSYVTDRASQSLTQKRSS